MLVLLWLSLVLSVVFGEACEANVVESGMAEGKRSAENGILKFHKGTEDKLAQYVATKVKEGDAQGVVDAVDTFCLEEHWMMNLGNEKGAIVDKAVKEANPTVVLELGTYCGYSAVRLSVAAGAKEKSAFKYYTIDPHPQAAAKVLFEKAGLGDKIVQLEGEGKTVIPTLKKLGLEGKVDLLFIDHDKKAYLPDLLLVEQAGLLHPNSVVIADNVLVFHINDYLRHIKESGLYKSDVTHSSFLEYDLDKSTVDGVNVAVYKGAGAEAAAAAAAGGGDQEAAKRAKVE